MGVATLITVMTLVQGANLYVEQKIANLGTNVFRVGQDYRSRWPISRGGEGAQQNKNIYITDYRSRRRKDVSTVRQWARRSTARVTVRYQNKQARRLPPSSAIPQHGGYRHAHARSRPLLHRTSRTSHAGLRVRDRLDRVRTVFPGENPWGAHPRRERRIHVVGTFQKSVSVLGQDQDNFLVVPMHTVLKVRGRATVSTSSDKGGGGQEEFRPAQDDAAAFMRARRHNRPVQRMTLSISAQPIATYRSGKASVGSSSRSS